MDERQGFEPELVIEALERLLGGVGTREDKALLASPLPRPPTAEALVAIASFLRRRCTPVHAPPNRALLDIAVAGPPDDRHVDLTLPAGILAAACDGTVAQLGWAPSRSGGAALAAALGLPAAHTASEAVGSLEGCGHAWLPGDRYHGEAARPDLVGNSPLLSLLGPLVNPAPARCHVVGVRDPALTEPLARALGLLGAEGALVVTAGGNAWLALDGETVGHHWSAGRLEVFHLPGAGRTVDGLESGGAVVDAARIEATFDGLRGSLADAIALQAGAALWVGGLLPTFAEARRWARSRLGQRVDLAEFCGPPTSPPRTDPALASTSRRSPHPPRGGPRRPRDRRG